MTTLWCIGCGDIGAGVGSVMRSQGWNVTGFRRHPREDAPFPQRALDVLAPPEALRTALAAPDLSSPDYVIYTVTPSTRTEAAYRDAYDHGVVRLLTVLPATVKHVVLVSSTGVYAQSCGEWVDETSPTEPAGFSGQALLAGESHLRASGFSHTVVRLSGIYGSDRRRNVDRLRNRVPIVREPAVYTNRIHRDDAIGFLAHLLAAHARGQTLEPLYLCSDDDPAPEWEVMQWLADRLDLPGPVEGVFSGDQNKRCLNRRLHGTGYVMQFPTYREGYAAAFVPPLEN